MFIDEYEPIIKRKLDTLTFEGKVYIYPFGKLGKVTKYLLDKKNIESVPVDTKLNNLKKIEEVKLEEKDSLLIASNNERIYEEIRECIPKKIREKAIDLFPEDKKENLLKKIKESGIKTKNSVYKMDNFSEKMYIPLFERDFIQNWIFKYGAYFDEANLNYLANQVEKIRKKGRTIETALDIGANIGNHSLYMATHMNLRKIIAFEPIGNTYSILLKNIAVNELESNILPYNMAIGEKRGKGVIKKYSLDNIGGTSIQYSSEDGMFDIVSLDDLEFREKVDFIKIDVEGFEVGVIRGATKTIADNMPIMYIEIVSADNLKSILDVLEPLGYKYVQLTKEDYFFFMEE